MAGLRARCFHLCYRIGTPSRYFSVTAKKWSESSWVGFIGLGNMGGHMARNLLQKGLQVVAYDSNQEALSNFMMDAKRIAAGDAKPSPDQGTSAEQAAKGAKKAESPAAVAAATNRIITMLPASQHVEEVYCGTDGIFERVLPGSLLIDCSTIDPQVSKNMAEKAKEHSAAYLDAPVSGGVNAARDALLTFMVGGSSQDFAAAKKLLDLMGKNVVHCGPVGTGQAAKICNNMLLAISMIGTAETMNLGMKLGLDPKLLASILNTSSGRCWSSELYNPVPGVLPGVPSSNDYKGGFGTALMTKDLGLAQNAAASTMAFTPLGTSAHAIYVAMCDSGYSMKDFSSAFQYLLEQEKKAQ